MSLIETETPQKPKQYSERQDHGSAAGRKGHELYTVGNGARVNADWAEQVGRHKQAQNEQVIFANELLDDKDEKVVPLTEAEIKKAMAHRATLDVEYEDDADDYHVPIRIKNRL